MMPTGMPLDFSLLTLLTRPPHSPKMVKSVRLSTPGVRYRTVMSVSCNLTPPPGFDAFVVYCSMLIVCGRGDLAPTLAKSSMLSR